MNGEGTSMTSRRLWVALAVIGAFAGCGNCGGTGADASVDGGVATGDGAIGQCPEHATPSNGRCVCLPGYEGGRCDQCTAGYTPLGTECVTECNATTCNDRGTCSEYNEAFHCACETGWGGDRCEQCGRGYRAEGDGCVDICQGETCSGHGDCDGYSGRVICFCDDGWAGSRCGECADDYLPVSGGCVAVCQPGACNGHGQCTGTTGVPVCACEYGYTGSACEQCTTEYYRDGSNCLPRCQYDTCSGHGYCDASTGAAICTCQTGYTGTQCENCDFAYHDVSGTCTHVCAGENCSGHGSCESDTGAAVCGCYDTAQGARCDSCAPGYRVIDGVCKLPALGIDARTDRTCAWFENGTVRCWGIGYRGELGYGTVDRIGCWGVQVYMLGGVAVSGHAVHQVAVGHDHTCGLLDNDDMYCWGASDYGQLGYGNTADVGRTNGVLAGGPIQLGASATRIHAGRYTSCALLSGGSLRCWGQGGALGLGTSQPNIGDDELPTAIGPIDVGGVVEQLALGGSHSCALLQDGSVRCWGYNIYGELGYGFSYDFADLAYTRPLTLALGGSATQVVVGDYHSCALLSAGTVRCWGDNSQGQLALSGVTTVGERDTPADHAPIDLGGVAVQLEAGANHTCARLNTGGVRCWGSNGSGQLGYDLATYVATQTPAQRGNVNLAASTIDIALGESHTCALLQSGAVRCWGRQDYTCALGFETYDYVVSDPAQGSDVELFR